MTLRTYTTLFWISCGIAIFVFAWYAYLFSQGAVTFGFGSALREPLEIQYETNEN